MPAVGLPVLKVGIRFASGADNDGWLLGSSALPTQLGEPDDASVYQDVYTDVRAFSMNRGRSRELEQYQAGSGIVTLDNLTREYDPLNLSGSHVSGGVTQIQPGRRIRVTATHPTTSIVYDLFYGVIRDWVLNSNGFDATSTAQFSDALTDLNNTKVSVVTSAAASGTAAIEVLTAAGISRYEADAGIATLQATTFTSDTALNALQDIATSEQGAVYADSAGLIQYDSRHAILSEARSNTSQCTFGTGNLPITSIVLDYQSDLIKNVVTATRTGGAAQTSTDATSIATYGERTYVLADMMLADDTQAATTAAFILSGYKDPAVRVREITVAPQGHADLMTAVLARELRDRVTVTFQPPGGGSPISQELFVEGIQHSVTPQGQMSSRFRFSTTATAFGWTLGTSQLGTGTILAF